MIDEKYLNIEDELYSSFESYISSLMGNPVTDADYKILYVCDSNYLLTKMSRVRFWAIEELSKSPHINLQLTGPGFTNFDENLSLQENIANLQTDFDMVIWYKPLNANYNYDTSQKLPYKTMLRYNEMWDVEWTQKEIDDSQTDIVVCHHYNDYLKYIELYKSKPELKFVYIPHQANPAIFKPLNIKKDIDILISGALDAKHYPFRNRLAKLILNNKHTVFKNYNVVHHIRPRQVKSTNFSNEAQIEYNKIINRSKLCVVCSSNYNYRLGKYVEIPMAGSVAIGDLPFEDKRSFERNNIVLQPTMSDNQIIKTIIKSLQNSELLKFKMKLGAQWAANFTTAKYVESLTNLIRSTCSKKIFIISDNIPENHVDFKGQKWICDELKEEFMRAFPEETTNDPLEAGIVWYLAPWNYAFTPPNLSLNQWYTQLKYKKVVCSQHHIDENKLQELDPQFKFMKKHSNKIHAICDKTTNAVKKHLEITDDSLVHVYTQLFWVDSDIFHQKPKDDVREKYGFAKNAYLVGSFQKDTEGKTGLPKLSKGPDIFVEIVKDMHSKNNAVEVVLTGTRREYILSELELLGIKYHYFNMVTLAEINDLYNSLDMYIVSSRCEGGPRAIVEAGLTKTPIISTDVGIASELMDPKAIFDVENWRSYSDAEPNADLLYDNVSRLTTQEYLNEFKNSLIL